MYNEFAQKASQQLLYLIMAENKRIFAKKNVGKLTFMCLKGHKMRENCKKNLQCGKNFSTDISKE